jgi:lipopolysaccharide transport system permease protein
MGLLFDGRRDHGRQESSRIIPMITARLRKIYSQRFAVRDLAFAQLKSKYAGSLLGLWWAVFTPLLLATSINFVFEKVFKVQINNYTLFALAGIIPWIFSTNALLEVTNAFSVRSPIFKQGMLLPECVPFSSVLANFFNFIIGFVFLLPVFVIVNFGVIKFTPFLIIVLLLHLMFLLGLGLLFSLINVFFRDFTHFLAIFTMIWFWITPVFYPLEMLPFPFRWVCLANPMSYYLIVYQDILFQAKFPSLTTLCAVFLLSTVTFAAAYFIFVKHESRLMKRI